jgi:hypothetical protein
MNNMTERLSMVMPYLKDPWTASWILSGLMAIFVPITVWSSHRAAYFSNYGYAQQAEDYYEMQKRYYEEQQNGDDGNNNNNNNNDNNGNQSYYKECSWINWPCRRRQWQYATYSQDNGNGEEVQQSIPGWYVFLGGETEQMERWREENTGDKNGNKNGNNNANSAAGLNFAYFLTLGLFISLVVYGAMTIQKRDTTSGPGSPFTNLTIILIITSLIGLMNLLTSVNAISTDNRDLEDSYYGWYGQTSVLMVYTDFWILLFSFGFLVVFQIRNYLERVNFGAENSNGNNGHNIGANGVGVGFGVGHRGDSSVDHFYRIQEKKEGESQYHPPPSEVQMAVV